MSSVPPQPHVYQDIQGWFNFAEGYDRILARAPLTPSCIVELGTWAGKSLTYLAVEVINKSKPVTIVAVDWFRPYYPESDAPAFDVRRAFDRNLAPFAAMLGERFVVLEGPTQAVGRAWVPPHPVVGICVDAGHSEEMVRGDLEAWWPHLEPGGIMFGDDYHPVAWPGVVRAVDRFFREQDRPVEVVKGVGGYPFWLVEKP